MAIKQFVNVNNLCEKSGENFFKGQKTGKKGKNGVLNVKKREVK